MLPQFVFEWINPTIFVLVVFGTTIWSCWDAESRGKSGVLISLLVWLTWPIGLVLWLLYRPCKRLQTTPTT